MLLPPIAGPARTSLVALGELVVPEYRARVWWYHKQIADALEGALRWVRFKGRQGGYARVAISMPPQHGKSLHGTELFPALALGQDPDLKIIAASNTVRIAKKSLANTRTWMSHPGYLATFPTRFGEVEEFDVGSGRRTRVLKVEDSAQFFRTIKPKPSPLRGRQHDLNDMEEAHGYYLAQGIGGSITGWGYDIGIGDDFVKNAEQAQNPRYHEKLWEFFTSVFATRQRSEHAVQIYIGTRWTNPDFADELIDYWQGQSTPSRPLPIKVVKLPALADGELTLPEEDPRRDKTFVDLHGHGLDKPSQRSEGYYEAERAGLMATTPWVWFGMYQQAPRMTGTKFFQPHEWQTFNESFGLHQLTYVDFSIDANLSVTGPSYAVITVMGVLQVNGEKISKEEHGEHYFLLDEARGHWSYEDLEREFLRLRRKWEIALPRAANDGAVWVENKALGPQLIHKFQGGYPIVAVPKAKSKIFCYRVAAPVASQQRVRIPVGTWGTDPTDPTLPLVTDQWVGDAQTKGSWVHEMKSYPSKPDDRRDAFAQEIIMRTSWIDSDILRTA